MNAGDLMMPVLPSGGSAKLVSQQAGRVTPVEPGGFARRLEEAGRGERHIRQQTSVDVNATMEESAGDDGVNGVSAQRDEGEADLRGTPPGDGTAETVADASTDPAGSDAERDSAGDSSELHAGDQDTTDEGSAAVSGEGEADVATSGGPGPREVDGATGAAANGGGIAVMPSQKSSGGEASMHHDGQVAGGKPGGNSAGVVKEAGVEQAASTPRAGEGQANVKLAGEGTQAGGEAGQPVTAASEGTSTAQVAEGHSAARPGEGGASTAQVAERSIAASTQAEGGSAASLVVREKDASVQKQQGAPLVTGAADSSITTASEAGAKGANGGIAVDASAGRTAPSSAPAANATVHQSVAEAEPKAASTAAPAVTTAAGRPDAALVQQADASASVAPMGGERAVAAPPVASSQSQGNAAMLQMPVPDNLTEADAQNVARVTRGLHNAVNQRGGAVTLRLNPPEMGVVRIHMRLSENTIQAQLSTQTETARSLLQNHMTSLRRTLEGQGLVVERLTVQTMPSSSNSSQTSHDQQGQSHDGRSRGGYSQQHGSQDGRHQQQQRRQLFEQQLFRFE